MPVAPTHAPPDIPEIRNADFDESLSNRPPPAVSLL